MVSVKNKIIELLQKNEELKEYFKSEKIKEEFNQITAEDVHIAVNLSLKYIKYLNDNNKNNEVEEFINKYIFRLREKENIYDINLDSSKKTLMFHTFIWSLGGVTTVLEIMFEKLKENYNIILLTSEVKSEIGKVKKGINYHMVYPNDSENILMIMLFTSLYYSVDIYIGNDHLYEIFFKVYETLNNYPVKTIAYNHVDYFYLFKNEWTYPPAVTRHKYYEYIDAVVWITNYANSLYNIFYKNSINIPNPNKYDIEIDYANYNKEKTNTIIAVGRFEDKLKHIELTIKCFSKVLESVPNAKLCVVGSINFDMEVQENKTLNMLIDELGLKGKIEFVIGKTEIREYYKNADILIMTSESEAFPMIINEAAVNGTPSIAFNIGGLSEIIENNKNGYLVNLYNIEDMVTYIVQFLTNEEERILLSKNAFIMSKRFDKNVIIEDWINLFDRLLSNEVINNSVNLDTSIITKTIFEYEKDITSKLSEIIQYRKETEDDHKFLAVTKLLRKYVLFMRKIKRSLEKIIGKNRI